MDLIDTHIVRPDDERPNRTDGTCFYCRAPMGTPHNTGCVIISKTVVVRMTMDLIIDVPSNWDSENVDFKLNDSSWCVDNMLEALGRWAEANEETGRCACNAVSGEFVRDATEDDHEVLPVLTGC